MGGEGGACGGRVNFLNCCGAAKLRGATSDAAPGAVPIGRRWGMALRVRHWSTGASSRPQSALGTPYCAAAAGPLRTAYVCAAPRRLLPHATPHLTSPHLPREPVSPVAVLLAAPPSVHYPPPTSQTPPTALCAAYRDWSIPPSRDPPSCPSRCAKANISTTVFSFSDHER